MEIEGEFVNFSDTEGYHIIKVSEGDLLDEINDEIIADYARWTLNMIPEDSVYSSLDDFDIDDIVDYLEEEGYNFSKNIGEEDCIDFLEDSGYLVTLPQDVEVSLDYIDNKMLEEITNSFLNASVFEREKMYNLITK